jgi:DNA-binding NarL/FixJ family response regulator
MTFTLLLVDDHEVVREGLRALLQAEPGFTVVGEAADGINAVRAVEALRPDVLVLDLVMQGMHGLEVTRRVKELAPRTRILVLTMHATDAYVVQALRNGADGYVLKDARAEELIHAVRQVAAGRGYLSPSLEGRALDGEAAGSADGDAYDELTAREREILDLAAQGLSSRDIAERLFISPRTAEGHRAKVMAKLGLRSQTELVRYAIARGVVPPPPPPNDAATWENT